MLHTKFLGNNAIFLVFLTPIVRDDRRKIKQNWLLSHKTRFLYRDWAMKVPFFENLTMPFFGAGGNTIGA